MLRPSRTYPIRTFDGNIDTVITHPKFGKQLGWAMIPETFNLYFVDLAYVRTRSHPWSALSYFAIDWLSPLTAHYKTACDCSLQVLMNRGCQKSYHQ